MSAMAQMVADLLLKSLPDEVRVQLTPENFEKIGNNIKSKWSLIEGSLTALQGDTGDIIDRLERIEKRLNNDDDSSRGQLTVIDGGSSDDVGSSGSRGSRSRRRAIGDGN